MTITKDRKKIPAINVFNTIENFILYLKDNYNNINFEDFNIKSSIEKIYDKLIDSDGNIPSSRLFRWIRSQFGFKFGNKFSLPFWIERGFNEEDYKNFSESAFLERVNNLKKYMSEKKILSFDYDPSYSKIFKYNTISYESDSLPKCNICNSDLIVKKSIENGVYIFDIKSCSNEKCNSNISSKLDIKWNSYLPIEKYLEVKNKLKSVKRCFSKDFWINKGMTEEESIKKVSEIQSNNSRKFKGKRVGKSKEFLRKKGLSEEEIRNVCLSNRNIEFWVKSGLTEKEAIDKISEMQKHSVSFINYEDRLLPSNIEYWKNRGYSDKESIELVKKSQTTFSKEICINKWGEEKGIEIFNERNRKWQKSLFENGNLKCGYSKISQELFFKIKEKLEGNFKFFKNGGEICFRENGKNYLYDFVDINRKKIIEYNGDQYHANPVKYNESDIPHPYYKKDGLTSKEIWSNDDNKKKLAIKRGFDVLVIWDSEYKKDKQKILEKCINFLLN